MSRLAGNLRLRDRNPRLPPSGACDEGSRTVAPGRARGAGARRRVRQRRFRVPPAR